MIVNFTDLSIGEITTWNWQFGDGNSSDKQSPSHTYDSIGTYTVCLILDGPGGSDSLIYQDYINVDQLVNIDNNEMVVTNYKLFQNYPNPFNHTTKIKYSLAKTTYVDLKMYNSSGKIVKVIIDGEQLSGYHQVEWDAADMPRGIYFYKIITREFVDVKKCIN